MNPDPSHASCAVPEEAYTDDAAEPAPDPLPPQTTQPKRVVDAVARLLVAGGAWDGAGKGRGRPAPPTWLWDALAAEHGPLAAAAADAADAASAMRYFAAGEPRAAARASGVAHVAALAAAAAAAPSCFHLGLELTPRVG